MNITLHGVRGSIPTTSPETKKYGGNTSCIEVEADGWQLILDAGSGIQTVQCNNDRKRIDILLTHLHIDHIQGLGFFRPLFDASFEIHIWGPASSAQSLRARLGRYFSPPLFPVYFRSLSCNLSLHEIDDSRFQIGPFTIQSCYIIHPGPTVGYRVEHQSQSLAYLPDHEPVLGCREMLQDRKWLSGDNLAFRSNLLLHDAQYSAEEYKCRVGWGHSSMNDALQFARLMEVDRILLMHHDPLHTDAELDRLFNTVTNGFPFPFQFGMAYEGLNLQL